MRAAVLVITGASLIGFLALLGCASAVDDPTVDFDDDASVVTTADRGQADPPADLRHASNEP